MNIAQKFKGFAVFLLDFTARIQSQIPFSPLGYEWIWIQQLAFKLVLA